MAAETYQLRNANKSYTLSFKKTSDMMKFLTHSGLIPLVNSVTGGIKSIHIKQLLTKREHKVNTSQKEESILTENVY